MVTASHNPKQDNGFKVYWNTGSQIVPPHDTGIAEAISRNLQPWQKNYDTIGVESHSLAENVTQRIATAYYQAITRLSDRKEQNDTSSVKAVYTGKEIKSARAYDTSCRFR